MSTVEKAVVLPTLPLKNSMLFPHLLMPLAVGRPASIAAIEAALTSEDKSIFVVAQRNAEVEEPQQSDLFTVGTTAVIKRMERADGGMRLIIQGMERAELLALETGEKGLKAHLRPLPEPADEGPEVEALHREVLEQAARIHATVDPEAQLGLDQIMSQVGDVLHQIYLLASMLGLNLAQSQQLLEAPTRAAALRLVHEYLGHEVQVLELRQKIASQAQTEMGREQREYLLRQQMRAIQEELGEQSPEQADAAEMRRRLEEADLPEDVRQEAARELARLERMPTAAPDYQITRSHLELIVELPWRKYTEDKIDLVHARQILDQDHFDLKEVKERIIEQLAVLKLNPSAKAAILCFVGPPGVGKTSLGQSIARALGRAFERMSLGGLHDEAELRGHRRTYIGAMPGRVIRAIRRAGVANPVLLLDEVDKVGADYRGDPAAALLEILDPAQNGTFHDNYLDLPFDLSKVMFITTANTLDTIPRPLRDRMEILRLAGYTDEEKIEIARRYLLPRQLREAGLTPEQLVVADETVARIIRRYTREAGLRELERMLGRVARKVAVRFAEGQFAEGGKVEVRPEQLTEIVGPERFFQEEARRELPPGVAAGLAWTEAGGDVLYVEAALLPDQKGLILTGQLGEVMQESAKTAQSYLWSRAGELGIEQKTVTQSGVHIHVPAGAIPKDGPSAGVTMATALASLYAGAPARSDTAMTGEITLTGLVMPVGGIKEKVLAARRAGIRRLILPKQNERDLDELPESVRRELEVLFVGRIEDVLAAAVPAFEKRFRASPASYRAPGEEERLVAKGS
ncbi:MAG TPA: endopeptidase La [Pirellulales bacterium]|jgi:ATP-dependent Lon protease|nr:endopeptidase La [Pirellulales bacterium]